MLARKWNSTVFAALLLAALAAMSVPAVAAPAASASPRTRESFNLDWKFARFGPQPDGSTKAEPGATEAMVNGQAPTGPSDPAGAATVAQAGSPAFPDFDDSKWQNLDVPHDWAIAGPFRKDLDGGTGKLPWKAVGWYRKHFTIPAADKGKRVFIDFDGAMANAQVWLNGHYVGTWPYGYASFRLELTDHLNFGGDNVLAVRLDTVHWGSRWYPGGGIFRNVWLVKTAPVHVSHWGVFVSTPVANAKTGKAKITITIDNQSSAPADIKINTAILERNPDGSAGKRVAWVETTGSAHRAGKFVITNPTIAIASPKLWDIDSPNLYIARVTLTSGGKVVDVYDQRFGFRTIEFTPRDGFHLNGRRVQLKGSCNHHDLGPLGAAFNTSAMRRQLRILKEMGDNALRTSHNPPAPELLDLADEMGMVVMDEAFDCWAHGKRRDDYSRLYKDWHKRDLQALVHRDRNHPSVILWSIGNEIREQNGPEPAKELADIVRAEDPTRFVTAGCNGTRAATNGFQKAVDVFGVNYHPGSYARHAQPRRQRKTALPLQRVVLGHQLARRVLLPRQGRQGRPEGSPGLLLRRRRRPLGLHPGRRVRRTREEPRLRRRVRLDRLRLHRRAHALRPGHLAQQLLRHRRPLRIQEGPLLPLPGPLAAGSAHGAHPAPLELAGPRRQGHARRRLHLRRRGRTVPQRQIARPQDQGHNSEYRLRWDDVKYQPGELKVVAYKNGKKWAEDTVRTTGPAAALTLTPERPTIAGDGKDLAYVTVAVTDKAGLTVPTANDLVKFTVEGPGEIVAVGNGDATNHESFTGHQHKAFNGLCLVIVRAKRPTDGSATTTGKITLKATAEGLAPAETTIQAK